MPPRKGTPTGRSVGAAVEVVAENPYATPDPGPRDYVRRDPVKKYIVPAAAPRPEVRAHGHVLTDRGWVREERNTNG